MKTKTKPNFPIVHPHLPAGLPSLAGVSTSPASPPPTKSVCASLWRTCATPLPDFVTGL